MRNDLSRTVMACSTRVVALPHAVMTRRRIHVMARPFQVRARLDRAAALSIPVMPVARSSRAMMPLGWGKPPT